MWRTCFLRAGPIAAGSLLFGFHSEQAADGSRAAVFYDELIDKLQSQNSLQGVSLAWTAPLAGRRFSNVAAVEGRTERVHVIFNEVAPSFFRLLNIPIVRGRAFLDSELDESRPVMVVSESTARRLWPGTDPIGKRTRFEDRPRVWQVVGVAKDVYHQA